MNNNCRKGVVVHPSIGATGSELICAYSQLLPVKFKSCTRLSELPGGEFVLSLSGEDNILHELKQHGVLQSGIRLGKGPGRKERAGHPRSALIGNDECDVCSAGLFTFQIILGIARSALRSADSDEGARLTG